MAEQRRFRIRFFGGENGDPRPVTFPIPHPWWCTGEDMSGTCTIVAIVDAANSTAARKEIVKFWPEVRFDEVEHVATDYMPPADRFPPRKVSP